MRGPVVDRPHFAFIEQLRSALESLGFTDIFVDTEGIEAGDLFEDLIHRSIVDCDLFIELIGRDWLRLLNEKMEKGERDILQHELASAIALEKDIVPLLVDGATMPNANDLPETIRQLSSIDAKPIASNSSIEALAAVLRGPVREASRVRRLGGRWTAGYVFFATAVWVFAAIAPNIVGMREFGYDSWMGMATAWSGMFIWPVFFLPLILLALYRPFQILLEATLNARSFRDALSYASPVVFGTAIAIGMTVVEISPPQVPWTIHPKLGADCRGPPDPGPAASDLASEYDQDRRTLASYATAGAVPARYRNEFWMKDKCWPNVFFYMTVPLRGLVVDEAYTKERATVQKAFLRMLATESKAVKGTDAPFSTLFPFYALAFFLMIWALSVAIFMAAIYAIVNIRRPRDGRVLRVPSEDAFLCLTHAFVTLLVWVPFRMTTNSIKFSYYCVDLSTGCGPVWETFAKDGIFGLALLLGYTCLTVGMLWSHKRLLLGFLGTALVCAIAVCSVAIAKYHETIAQLVEFWQFWVAASLLISVMLIALWYQYDPALVRFRDFQERLRSRNGR